MFNLQVDAEISNIPTLYWVLQRIKQFREQREKHEKDAKTPRPWCMQGKKFSVPRIQGQRVCGIKELPEREMGLEYAGPDHGEQRWLLSCVDFKIKKQDIIGEL